MEQKTQNFWAKYGWIFAIGSAVLAILFLLLPILNYEIREAVYDTVTGDRLSKTDYVYNVNLITYFTSSWSLTFFHTMQEICCNNSGFFIFPSFF